MHKEILTKEQIELLPLVKLFSKDFFLVGGTAIGLHLGYRESIDFDLFSNHQFDNGKIIRKIEREFGKGKVKIIRDEIGQLTLIINQVYMTFFEYPFAVATNDRFESFIKLPALLTLAAMKAHALGRRAKWKDYVDLYFILQRYSLDDICDTAKNNFGNEFNQRIFREQLGYFDDIDYSQQIVFLPGFEVRDEEVKKYLTEVSLAR